MKVLRSVRPIASAADRLIYARRDPDQKQIRSLQASCKFQALHSALRVCCMRRRWLTQSKQRPKNYSHLQTGFELASDLLIDIRLLFVFSSMLEVAGRCGIACRYTLCFA